MAIGVILLVSPRVLLSASPLASDFSETAPHLAANPRSSIAVETMLQLAGVRATDFLIDLGAGTGNLVIRAAKTHGARGIGVDRDAKSLALAAENANKSGIDDKIKFVQQDVLQTELGAATVISMNLPQDRALAIRPRLFALKPGTRIVSHDAHLGEWVADAKTTIAGPEKSRWVYLWVVPAKVAGAWESRLPAANGWVDAKLIFRQQFQQVSGEVLLGIHRLPMERASLAGDFLSFRIEEANRPLLFNGYVSSGRIAGQVTRSGENALRWRALRQ